MTHTEHRRTFLKQAAAVTGLAFVPFTTMQAMELGRKRKFTMGLNPGAIGVRLDQEQLLSKAMAYGFESIVAYSGTLAGWSDTQIDDFTARMKKNKISWGAAGLPMDFRQNQETHQKGIAELPNHAKALQKAG
ncbi:MAG: sugar phosphate isomerase/epimerase, partial [Cyclobacteriaceae bacterium]|nr:sugar phosphate isomerase/epimerase [Cyclobacteriaceae bacterium]